MHNLLSRSQLNGWRHFENNPKDSKIKNKMSLLENNINILEDETNRLNDYYECLVECDSLNQPECKRICKRILV